jgi:Stress responsive A/B Barrel Domain
MIRHIVLLTLRPDAPAEAGESIVRALRGLPAQIGSIRDYQAGVDLGLNPGNATVAATATFDDEAGYLEYRDHPAHKAVIQEYIDPVRQSRAGIQFEL